MKLNEFRELSFGELRFRKLRFEKNHFPVEKTRGGMGLKRGYLSQKTLKITAATFFSLRP